MAFKRLLQATEQFIEKVKNPLPPSRKTLFKFATAEDRALWQAFADSQIGGMSTAELVQHPDVLDAACFRGVYSRQLNKGASERLKRSGFAGISARAGRYLDLDEFHSIIFNVQGDGRTYLANIRTDNWVVGENAEDVWQAFLFARAGEWCEVEIPLDRFLLTWRGKLVEQEVEMNRARITGIGISIAGGDHLQEEGEFALGLRSVCVKSNASLDSLDD